MLWCLFITKKMSFSCLGSYFRCSYISLRALKYFPLSAEKCRRFSTSEKISSKNNTPVKFTTSKGSEIPIEETIGINTNSEKYTPKYEKLVILTSFAVFLVYFCMFREENDIDEMLKGNQYKNRNVELLNLKIKLLYCQQNNLPTEAIKAKIKEIEMEELVKLSLKN